MHFLAKCQVQVLFGVMAIFTVHSHTYSLWFSQSDRFDLADRKGAVGPLSVTSLLWFFLLRNWRTQHQRRRIMKSARVQLSAQNRPTDACPALSDSISLLVSLGHECWIYCLGCKIHSLWNTKFQHVSAVSLILFLIICDQDAFGSVTQWQDSWFMELFIAF